MSRPNPLTDELSDQAKAELAAVFADLALRIRPIDPAFEIKVNLAATRGYRPWEI
jgi:hypothetical protein